MGELIQNTDFLCTPPRYDPRLYFSDLYWGSRRTELNIEFDYPFTVAIERTYFDNIYNPSDEEKRRWVLLRKFIERQLTGDVIYQYLSKDFYYKRNKSVHEYGHMITHGYYVFYFETEIDRIQFALQYQDVITKIKDRSASYID